MKNIRPTQIQKNIHEQLNEKAYYSIIEHYGLNQYEVVQIVKEWYINGMCDIILQDENGNDLEEICERICDILE